MSIDYLSPTDLAAEIERAKAHRASQVCDGECAHSDLREDLAEIEHEFVKALANCEQPNPALDPPFVKVDGVEECVAVVECSRILVAARKELETP